MNDLILKQRKEYLNSSLDIYDVLINPIEQFDKWFKEAINSQIEEPNAMSLATVNKDLQISVRIVLLKDYSENGFTFFTNYNSNKGKDIEFNNKVGLNFFWGILQRQIRIQGIAYKISKEESEKYFNSRPIGSRISAIISPQSQKIPNREFLEEKYKKILESNKIEKPENWGGYIVKPYLIEFWQGRENRLHDRIVYELINNNWEIYRLAP